MTTIVDLDEAFSAGEVCEILHLEPREYLDLLSHGDLRATGVFRTHFPCRIPYHCFWDILDYIILSKLANWVPDLSIYRNSIYELLDLLSFEVEDGNDLDRETLDRSITALLHSYSSGFIEVGTNPAPQRIERIMRIVVTESVELVGSLLISYLKKANPPYSAAMDIAVHDAIFS